MIKLPKIQIDKLEHSFWALFGFAFLVPFIGIHWALGVSAIWWGVREIYSRITGKGKSEWLDFVFSMWPILIVFFVLWVKDLYLLNKLINLIP